MGRNSFGIRETAGTCWQRRIHAHRMRLGSHESHLGAHKASGLARTAPRRTRAPRMRAGSHERHPRAQNASGLARTAPRRVRAPRMRAGTHERHIGHLKSFIKKSKVSKHLCFISKNLRQQKSRFEGLSFCRGETTTF